MKYIIIIFLLIFVFIISCNNEYNQILSNVDRIKIIADIDKNDYVELINKQEVKTFLKFLKTRSLHITPCGFVDGWIEFYDINNNLIINAWFNFQCKQMIFSYNDTHYDIKISDKGIIYLKNITNNVNRY